MSLITHQIAAFVCHRANEIPDKVGAPRDIALKNDAKISVIYLARRMKGGLYVPRLAQFEGPDFSLSVRTSRFVLAEPAEPRIILRALHYMIENGYETKLDYIRDVVKKEKVYGDPLIEGSEDFVLKREFILAHDELAIGIDSDSNFTGTDDAANDAETIFKLSKK